MNASIKPIDKQISISFSEIADRYDNLDPLAPQLAQIVYRDIMLRFESSPATTKGGEVYGGVVWHRLTDYTFKMHPHRKTGVVHIDTGDMMRAVTRDGSGNAYRIVDRTFEFELLNPKAVKNHPLRPIAVVHERLTEQIAEKVLEYVVSGNSVKR